MDAPAERQERPDARRHLADEAAAHEQLVADAASASAGASRRVGRKSWEARAITGREVSRGVDSTGYSTGMTVSDALADGTA